jgi:hypothetical protein
MSWQDIAKEFGGVPGQSAEMCIQTMAKEISELRVEKEMWGNEFAAITYMKQQLSEWKIYAEKLKESLCVLSDELDHAFEIKKPSDR